MKYDREHRNHGFKLKCDTPMINPLDAPEKRPSVIRAVELPRPAPIRAAVGPVVKPNERTIRVNHSSGFT